MNGVVFQTSAMMITARELMWPPNQALSIPSAGSTKPVPGEKANCHANAADNRDDPVGDQDRGANHSAPEDRPVHDQRDQHPQRQLDRDRDRRDDHGVEARPATTAPR